MCFFDQYKYACGDFKWGYFRQHCAKEYRTGETCGMKLVMQTYEMPNAEQCKLCTKIETKLSRIHKEEDRIRRWEREGSSRKASIEASKETISHLQEEVDRLLWQRAQLRNAL